MRTIFILFVLSVFGINAVSQQELTHGKSQPSYFATAVCVAFPMPKGTTFSGFDISDLKPHSWYWIIWKVDADSLTIRMKKKKLSRRALEKMAYPEDSLGCGKEGFNPYGKLLSSLPSGGSQL